MQAWPLLLMIGWRVLVAPSLVKVRPTGPLPPGVETLRRVELELARGECEGVQLVIEAGDAPARQVRVSVDRHGADGLELSLYREAFLQVRTPSNVDGAAGAWPDALVPELDPIAREPRSAFPVDVAAGTRQPVLVEACAGDAPRKLFHHNLYIHNQQKRIHFELTVRVHEATIPATSTFPVTFGLSGRNLEWGHYGRKVSDDARLELVERYGRLALRYRVSLHTLSRVPPRVTRDAGGLAIDFSRLDAELSPLLDGPRRFSAIDLRLPDDLPRADWHDYARLTAAHFAARAWLPRLFAYVMDEPKPAERAELVSRLDALAGTGVTRLVTMPRDPALDGRVDLWAPNLNCFDHKRFRGEYCADERPRSDYGAQVWWYQSCSSHGCGHGPFGDARDDYFRGWPSYMVDADGASARIMGWQAFANDVTGELYFDTVHAFHRWDERATPRVDPWEDLFAFGGNGDGTLFYPGRPDRIGGTTHVPVASLRLHHLRDGLEELELLRLLSARGAEGWQQARDLARRMAPRLFDFEHDPRRFDEAHRALLQALDRPPSTALPSRVEDRKNRGAAPASNRRGGTRP